MAYKAPPELNDDKSFSDWKKEVEFWQIATDVKPERQGAMIFLSLKGKSREAVRELTKEEISTEGGVQSVLDKLDTLWKEDENLEAFNAYEKFEKYKRPNDMGITEYIAAFERLNNRLIATQTNLPEGVLAYRLLKSAGLTEEQEQLAKATVQELTYKSMCGKLKSIFGDDKKGPPAGSGAKDWRDDAIRHLPEVKKETFHLEETYFNNQRYPGPGGSRGGAGSRGFGGRQRYDFSNRRNYQGNNYNRGTPRFSNTSPRHPFSSGANQDARSRRNPVDMNGQVSKCLSCGSMYHWRMNCPNMQQEKPSFTMYTNSIHECYMSKLVGETFLSGVLDCGCTKTVCGVEWYKEFLSNLNEDDKGCVQETSSQIPYKFGGSEAINSFKRVVFPIYVGSQRGMLEAEVIESDLPLLISKETMKKTGMILNFDRDTATFNGEEISLDTTSSGHYALSLTKPKNQLNLIAQEKSLPSDQVAFLTFNVEGKSDLEKTRMAKKLHSQFGHPSHEKLTKLVQSAGVQDSSFIDMIKECSAKCETCIKYSRKNPRPIVGMALSNDFNSTIAMDLKQIDKHIILHIIDLATRYSNAVVIADKRKETVVEAIIRNWVNIFGVPDRVLSDNGGEFNNRDFLDMAENLNTEVMTTAAESPWSNGVCERHNGVIGNMVKKTMDESHCDIRTALAWAINAKNCLHNVYGFSPAQLVFGRNPNLPSVLNDKLPALNGVTASEQVARNLKAKHEARKAFIENESSEKLRRALRHNVRESSTAIFESGDKVYYKRLESDFWRGPATVIGRDDHQVILKHGGSFVRAHPVSLKKLHDNSDVHHEKGASNMNKSMPR